MPETAFPGLPHHPAEPSVITARSQLAHTAPDSAPTFTIHASVTTQAIAISDSASVRRSEPDNRSNPPRSG